MCGGRDFDRMLFDNIVMPWLMNKFALPEDFSAQAKYRSLLRMAIWATERAKIELSSKMEAAIALSETELGVRDEAGVEIYLDITIDRAALDRFD